MVDGEWTTDHTAPQEDDGHGNLNNVLLPENIKRSSSHKTAEEATGAAAAGTFGGAAMSGVTPSSTTAGLAGNVPRESSHTNTPGTFPETPATEPTEHETFTAKPIPASSGIGNPVHLSAGEKVPVPSSINNNTIESTATTDKAGYEQDASATGFTENTGTAYTEYRPDDSAFSVPEKSNSMIPESSLPIGQGRGADTTDTGPTIQSAAPSSTTAGLAGAVPREPKREAFVVEDEAPSATVTGPAADVPEVVKESLAQAHEDPEAAASEKMVEEKREVEQQLLKEVKPEQGRGEPAPSVTGPSATLSSPAASVPEIVKESFQEAHEAPEAAASGRMVEEKKQMERELLAEIEPAQERGEPAPSAAVSSPAVDSTPAAAVPGVVKESLLEAHQAPEAAASEQMVAEKKEMEQELLSEVRPEQGSGEPAPSATAATTETAPAPTGVITGATSGTTADDTAGATTAGSTDTGLNATAESPAQIPAKTEMESTKLAGSKLDAPKRAAEERDLSPMSKDPSAPSQPMVTTGVGSAKTDSSTTPTRNTTTSTPSSADSDATKEKKKKNRASGFFKKLFK